MAESQSVAAIADNDINRKQESKSFKEKTALLGWLHEFLYINRHSRDPPGINEQRDIITKSIRGVLPPGFGATNPKPGQNQGVINPFLHHHGI